MTYKDMKIIKVKRLCSQCIGEKYLSEEIFKQGKQRICAYCGVSGRTVSIKEMAGRIENVFERHYIRTPENPDDFQYSMLSDRESDYRWERDGEPVIYAIMNAASIPLAAAEDVQVLLEDQHYDFEAAKMSEETEFAAESYYEEKGPDPSAWMSKWQEFDNSLRSEARFFSKSAEQHLASIFDRLESLKTQDGRPVIVKAGPKKKLRELFRARVFQDDRTLAAALERPDQHLGPPPSRLASAGRMNARGISVFYGANTAAFALTEVRPPVGSRVAVARFEIIRPVRLLDLTAFDGLIARGSIFDAGYVGQLERSAFLRTLSQRLARPVMPDDEAFAYLATQAIADFLATSEERLDGIIYPSVQAGGAARNVVLFYPAARVRALTIPEGTEISASLYSHDEDQDPDYWVSERTPLPPPEKGNEDQPLSFANLRHAGLSGFGAGDWREETLQVDVEAINVHHISAVKVRSSSYSVRRHRWEKRELDF